MTAKTTIHKLCKDVKMENQNIIQVIATILSNIENHLAGISKMMDAMNSKLGIQKEKVTQKEKEFISSLGGIIGGDKIGGLRGKEKGGKKGGEFTDGKSSKSLADFNADEHSALDKLNQMIFGHLKDEVQIAYLSTREQKIHALKAIRKLNKLGYGNAQIEQALFNGFRDEFWNDKIRHLKALANTMKNGELVIMALLKKNLQNTKINAPVIAQYRG